LLVAAGRYQNEASLTRVKEKIAEETATITRRINSNRN